MTEEFERDMTADDYWLLDEKYQKLLEFVKEISNYSTCKYDYCPIPSEAQKLLKQIGETND